MSARNQAITQQIKQDWINREYIEVITSNIKRIAEFLNSFDMSCRSKLSQLNEKLTMLERRIEYLEARVTKGETLNWLKILGYQGQMYKYKDGKITPLHNSSTASNYTDHYNTGNTNSACLSIKRYAFMYILETRCIIIYHGLTTSSQTTLDLD